MTRQPMRPFSRLQWLLPLALLAAGCTDMTGARDAIGRNEPFIAVPSGSAGSDGVNETFYLAINREQLEERWFLSSYLKQFFPGAVSAGAARSLGTLVVSFRLQNGKLYVYNAGDGKASSSTFDPDLIVDAYPIVEYAPFDRLKGAERYVLLDPAAGLNRFAVVGDAFASGPFADRFSVELSYLQRFRQIADGVTYEQVFVGYGELPGGGGIGEPNAFRASGTLGISLRRYQESEQFSAQTPPGRAHYFRTDPLIVPNSGGATQYVYKWNIYPGMRPIKWLISDQFLRAQNDPYFGQFDIIGAVKAGIENWNEAFGFRVFEVETARPDQSFADDDVNYLIFDLDPSFGAAFADWRANPNTGEIRGASVYFNSLWLFIADEIFTDDPLGRSPTPAPQERPRVPSIVWEPLMPRHLCLLWAPPFRDGNELPRTRLPGAASAVAPLTRKEKVERYLTHIVLHEIGHTLGLRHNFRGSLVPPSSSVMEYIDDLDAVYADKPLPYDVAAVRYLYGLSAGLPPQPFCTDENVFSDVNCSTFDRGTDPLEEFYRPNYLEVAANYLEGSIPTAPAPNGSLNGVLKYVRAGSTPEQRLSAWSAAAAPVSVTRTDVPEDAGYRARLEFVARRLFARLYLDPASLRGEITNDPPASDTALHAAILAELEGNLVNADGFRSFMTRRLCVDVLKRIQTIAAYRVLLDAREAILVERSRLDGDDRLLTDDLLERIDEALSPYFY